MAVGEWDQRQLCPDGACIGVIGPEGTCKVCGRAAPNWGDERNRGLIDPEDEDPDEANLAPDEDEDGEDGDDGDDDEDGDDEDGDDEDDDEDGEDDDEDDEPSDPEAAPRGAWSVRQLCPDGACIGVIGPDGRCKTCGRPASEAPAEPPGEPATEPTAIEPTAIEPTAIEPTAIEPTAIEPVVAAAASVEPAAGDREPCPTPGCGGHIGADGRCATCGKGAS
jgi:hypothetical protein